MFRVIQFWSRKNKATSASSFPCAPTRPSPPGNRPLPFKPTTFAIYPPWRIIQSEPPAHPESTWLKTSTATGLPRICRILWRLDSRAMLRKSNAWNKTIAFPSLRQDIVLTPPTNSATVPISTGSPRTRQPWRRANDSSLNALQKWTQKRGRWVPIDRITLWLNPVNKYKAKPTKKVNALPSKPSKYKWSKVCYLRANRPQSKGREANTKLSIIKWNARWKNSGLKNQLNKLNRYSCLIIHSVMLECLAWGMSKRREIFSQEKFWSQFTYSKVQTLVILIG